MNKVFIIILNWNGKENTKDCLESLKKINESNLEIEIIVVDNASTDSSMKELSNLKSQISNLKLIENKENLGFSGGNNVGIGYALSQNADYILILNNDTFVHNDVIKELMKTAKKKNAGIVAPKIYFAKGYEFHKDRYKKEDLGKVIWYAGGVIDWNNTLAKHRGVDEVDKGQYNAQMQTEFASGCCMLIAREVFEKVGLFDEKYYLYYEDSDLSIRVKKAGYSIFYNPKAVLWHKNAGSAGGSGSHLQDYYITRNRLLFGIRYAPFRSKIALLKESIHLLFCGRKWQRRGTLDFYLSKFARGSYR